MPLVRIVCGNCGGAVTLHDAVCPQCGAAVEIAGTGKPPAQCSTCGHQNVPGALFCNACGSRLASAGETKAVRSKVSREKRETKRRDPWPYIVLTAIGVLVVLVVSTEWNSRTPEPRSGPAGPSAMQGAAVREQPVSTEQLAELRHRAESTPSNPSATLALANALQDNGSYNEAIRYYTEYLKATPRDADARVDMGICFDHKGLADSAGSAMAFARAVDEMKTAIRGVPTHQAAAFNLGIVYLHMGELDSSNVWLRRTVAINKGTDLAAQAQRIIDQHSFSR